MPSPSSMNMRKPVPLPPADKAEIAIQLFHAVDSLSLTSEPTARKLSLDGVRLSQTAILSASLDLEDNSFAPAAVKIVNPLEPKVTLCVSKKKDNQKWTSLVQGDHLSTNNDLIQLIRNINPELFSEISPNTSVEDKVIFRLFANGFKKFRKREITSVYTTHDFRADSFTVRDETSLYTSESEISLTAHRKSPTQRGSYNAASLTVPFQVSDGVINVTYDFFDNNPGLRMAQQAMFVSYSGTSAFVKEYAKEAQNRQQVVERVLRAITTTGVQ